MPTYEYVCQSCGHRFETVQSFSDAALTACPVCQGPLRKVFGNVGIVLKGSGFYKTDSRTTRSSSNGSGTSKESKETESTKGSGDDKTKDAKPAKESSAKESSSSGGSSTPASTAPAAASST
jgi:putative FmdB family regulatory protein